MNSVIDYIGSMVTGGMVFVMMVGFYFNIGTVGVTQSLTSSVQEDMASVNQVLEYDIRKAGYRVTGNTKISRADSTAVTLRQVLNETTGQLDSVQYYLSATPHPKSQNPNARVLYRVINGQTKTLTTLGVTRFRLWYYNASGDTTSTLTSIRSMKVALALESLNRMQTNDQDSALTRYPSAYWERVLKPQNLR